MEHFTKELNQADVTFKLKHIFCHDPGCWVCAQGKGHGPYWHATYEEQGQTHTIFLGKEFNPMELNPESEKQETPRQEEKKNFEQKSSSTNKAENVFHFKRKSAPKPPRIDLNEILAGQKRVHEKVESQLPPTRFDFERDLKILKTTLRADRLKSVYRTLTKKYHPDKYPGIGHINTWMAEINGQYSQMKRTINF